MGKRTSVYLTDAQTASLAALGTTMAEVVRAGFAALEQPAGPFGIPVRADSRMPDGFAAIVAPGNEPAVFKLPELKPGLYPCCSHCTHPPTVSGHGRRCLQCPA